MTPDEREAQILSLEPLVRIIAKKRMSTLPTFVSVEDLISAGWVGAINAVDRFDDQRGVRLIDYAKWRIHGAIGDYLRSIDPLSRHHRSETKRDGGEPVVILSIDHPVVTHGHHADFVVGSAHESIPDCRALRDQSRREARLTLKSIYGRARLRPRNAKVLRRWIDGENMKDIGESIGVGESCISQICTNAIRKLRQAA